MDVKMQAMGHQNRLVWYKPDCIQLACARYWIGASKANQGGVHIRVVQLVP